MGETELSYPPKSDKQNICELLDTWCPYMLEIGMSYQDYWYGDPNIAKYYIEKDKIHRKRLNQEHWLEGLYFYQALCDVAPMLNAFAKKGTRPQKYLERPFPLSEEEIIEERNNRMLKLKSELIEMSERGK